MESEPTPRFAFARGVFFNQLVVNLRRFFVRTDFAVRNRVGKTGHDLFPFRLFPGLDEPAVCGVTESTRLTLSAQTYPSACSTADLPG
jgi:hypothetical protein